MDHQHVFNANSSDSFHSDISGDYGSAMSDTSSGHTEIIPSQSSHSDWSDGHQAVDDDGFNLPDITERFSSHESNDGSHLSSQESEGRQVEDEITSGRFILPDSVEPVSGSKSVHYQGYQYSFYHGSGATRNYRSSSYRRTQCLAKLYISRMGTVVRGNHKSDCVPEMRQVPNGPPPTFVNWKQQMLLATDDIGIRDVTLSPREVWQIIREQFYSDDSIIVQGATKKQIMGRLYRTRRNHFGREFFGRIEIEPLCDVKHSPGLKFFQFHFTYYEDEVLHRVIGWSHPLLMDRLKQRHCSLFVDATFRCVPTQFYQLVVVMMYDPISDLYLPVWYVLTSGKTSHIYEHIFHYICVASKKRLDPAHIVCDFEFAMIKAVKDQFPDSRIVGCLFHFKQALRRKMLKLKITEEEVALAIREGCIDGLTLIRRCDIVFRGIPDVRRMIKRDCRDQGILYSRESWKKFWKYFTNTWIKKFVPEWWNVNGLNEDIVNRTNNPLERYNRTLNDAFSVPHPDVVQFISAIEKQSRDNVRLINDISNRRARAPSHASPQRGPRFESDYHLEVESQSDLADSDDLNSDDDSDISVSPEYRR